MFACGGFDVYDLLVILVVVMCCEGYFSRHLTFITLGLCLWGLIVGGGVVAWVWAFGSVFVIVFVWLFVLI